MIGVCVIFSECEGNELSSTGIRNFMVYYSSCDIPQLCCELSVSSNENSGMGELNIESSRAAFVLEKQYIFTMPILVDVEIAEFWSVVIIFEAAKPLPIVNIIE